MELESLGPTLHAESSVGRLSNKASNSNGESQADGISGKK
jgi:hypothetical protein